MEMKPAARVLLLLLFALGYSTLNVQAQADDETLSLSVRRDYGYRTGNRIQGRLSLVASSPQDLLRVEFLIDGETVFVDQESPFRYQFSTGDYAVGSHLISAVGYTAAGVVIPSETREFVFVSSDDVGEEVVRFAGPLVALALGATLLGTLGMVLIGRKKKSFKLGAYGAAGGAVCPRCEMPYSRSFLSPNLLVGKLERCPHCGKIAIVRRASPDELDVAERKWTLDQEQGALQVDREKSDLERMIEQSRFEE
jgi:hypothetical protein